MCLRIPYSPSSQLPTSSFSVSWPVQRGPHPRQYGNTYTHRATCVPALDPTTSRSKTQRSGYRLSQALPLAYKVGDCSAQEPHVPPTLLRLPGKQCSNFNHPAVRSSLGSIGSRKSNYGLLSNLIKLFNDCIEDQMSSTPVQAHFIGQIPFCRSSTILRLCNVE